MAFPYVPTGVMRQTLTLPSPGDLLRAASVNTQALQYLADSSLYHYQERRRFSVPPVGFLWDSSVQIQPASILPPTLGFNVVVPPPGSLTREQIYKINDAFARDGDWLYLGNQDGAYGITLNDPADGYLAFLTNNLRDSVLVVRQNGVWTVVDRNLSVDDIVRSDARFTSLTVANAQFENVNATNVFATELTGTLFGTMAAGFPYEIVRDMNTTIPVNRFLVGSALPGGPTSKWTIPAAGVEYGSWIFAWLGTISSTIDIVHEFNPGLSIVTLSSAVYHFAALYRSPVGPPSVGNWDVLFKATL